MRTLALFRDGHCLLPQVWQATRWHQRARGLLGRPLLQPGQGLWLAPCASVHTFGMRQPLDLLFLDAGLRVVGWRQGVPAWRAAGCRGAHSTLEMAPGSLACLLPVAGQQLHWQTCSPSLVSEALP